MAPYQRYAVAAALATVISAAPQKLDFAELAAAPTVADGPSAIDADVNGQQTATLLTSFTVTGATTASSAPTANVKGRNIEARGVVSSDVTDSAYNAKLGDVGQLTTINRGVTYWINGGSTHNFFGNIANSGRIFVSQTNYLKSNPYAGGQTSDLVGHDANNGNLQNADGALIQLNDIGSASAPTYDWYIRSLNNSGTIQWCGRGDTGGSTYQMYSDNDAYNTGLISFEQAFNNYGAAFVWRNPVLTTTNTISNLYNNGAFRIINVNYHNVQNVYGNGCWQIGRGGILYLEDGTGAFQNPTAGPSFPGQSISFQDPSSVLHLDTAVYSRNSNFGPQLYGFSTGNAIEFYQIISSWSYAPSTGILNVKFGTYQVNIKLGTGYDSSKFRQARNPQKYNVAGYNAIFYDGPAPTQSVPSKCGITAPVCSALSGGLPPNGNPPVSSTTSSSSTKSSTSSSTSSAVPTTTKTSTSSTVSSTSSSVPATITSSSSSSASVTTTSTSKSSTSSSASSTVSSCVSTRTRPTASYTPYTPYYPAITTGYTTDPALTATTTAGQACPTQPEAGTYCGFINPLDPCGPQPDGYGPVPTPDTASAFLAYSSLHSLAQAAPSSVPAYDGTVYQQVFKDLNGATSAQSYLGLYTLQTYSTKECAAHCDQTDFCTAFNLYAERDPALRPSTNDTAPTVWGNYCPNPPSMTSFKCTLWGSAIDASTATNTGETREQFQVVITASNGYDKTNATVPGVDPCSGYTKTPTNCNGKAVDAPSNSLGTKFFSGPFNPQVCSDFAAAQSKANADQGVKQSVALFNAYYLHKNGAPFGTRCSLYDDQVDLSKYATYSGGQQGGDLYEVKQSWAWGLK